VSKRIVVGKECRYIPVVACNWKKLYIFAKKNVNIMEIYEQQRKFDMNVKKTKN
jgi:hypothetical protein